jgi:hypothetical protein
MRLVEPGYCEVFALFCCCVFSISLLSALNPSFFRGRKKEAKKDLAKSNSSAAFCWLLAVHALNYEALWRWFLCPPERLDCLTTYIIAAALFSVVKKYKEAPLYVLRYNTVRQSQSGFHPKTRHCEPLGKQSVVRLSE